MRAIQVLPFALVITPLWLGTSLSASGAELRPYSLPSQQVEPRYEQRSVEPRAVRPQVSEDYYRNFERKVRRLKPAQREALVKSFERRRDDAVAAGRVDEAQHYLRQLQILNDAR